MWGSWGPLPILATMTLPGVIGWSTRACLAAAPGTASRARGPLAPLTSGLAWGPSSPGPLAPLALLTGHVHAMMRGEPLAPVVPHLSGRAPADKAKCVGCHLRKRERQCKDHWRNGTQTVHKLDQIRTNSYEIRMNFVRILQKLLYSHTCPDIRWYEFCANFV